MSYESIPNRTKKGKKFDYHKDVNATPLPNDIVELLRRTKARKGKNNVV